MGDLAFEKWEGLGNDFIVVEHQPSIDEIRRLCDRRRGVGADGVLVVEREADRAPRMIVFNADGSRPEMCGNGLRCVAAYLVSPATSRPLIVQTDAGERKCTVDRGTDEAEVVVDMGSVRFEAEVTGEIDGRPARFTSANIGNPHAVTFEPFEASAYERVGSALERSIPGGINVEFVRAQPGLFDVVVWERGVGFTQACGTGACAVAAVACRLDRARYGDPLRVRLPGGELSIEVERGPTPDVTGRILMRGPARRAFVGSWRG
ncbi:MAG: diaminopimelate epimerase [Polyangiaceae bacterium]|nr:diaminopimelate epimerase [Polyangiaceae bacterium]